MVHLLLTRVKIPANAALYFSSLLDLANYDLINTEPFLRKWLKLVEEEELDASFQSLGYDSVYFVINIGSLLLVAVYLLLKLLFVCLAKNVEIEWVQKKRVAWRKQLLWNEMLLYIEESLVVFSLCFFLQLQHISFSSGGKAFSTLLALTFGGVLAAFPFITLGLLIKHRHNLKTQECKQRFGSVYEDLNFKLGPSMASLLEPFASQIRVILMMTTMVFVEKPFL